MNDLRSLCLGDLISNRGAGGFITQAGVPHDYNSSIEALMYLRQQIISNSCARK